MPDDVLVDVVTILDRIVRAAPCCRRGTNRGAAVADVGTAVADVVGAIANVGGAIDAPCRCDRQRWRRDRHPMPVRSPTLTVRSTPHTGAIANVGGAIAIHAGAIANVGGAIAIHAGAIANVGGVIANVGAAASNHPGAERVVSRTCRNRLAATQLLADRPIDAPITGAHLRQGDSSMKNRVGSVIPSAEEIQQLMKDIERLAAKTERFTLMLSAEERQRTTKMRVRGERIVALVGTLAARHQIGLPRISVDGMTGNLVLAQRLAPLAPMLEALAQKVSDTIRQAQSECWWAAMAFYSALKRLSDVDPELEVALKPAVDFLARRPRSEPTAEA